MRPAPPPQLSVDTGEYGRRLGDVDHWRPWIQLARADAGLPAAEEIVSGVVGTFPTFCCDGTSFVKLFSDLSWARDDSAAELDSYRCLVGDDLPVPPMLASGQLYPNEGRAIASEPDRDGLGRSLPETRDGWWPWPYLILGAVDGQPIGEGGPCPIDVARQLGDALRRLHQVDLGQARDVLKPTWGRFIGMLRERRASMADDERRTSSLAPHLRAELDDFVPRDPADLVDTDRLPVLVHGDVHGDHVFVDPEAGRLTGIIDFGDAWAGDPDYELLALHAGTFGWDTSVLAGYLDSYGYRRHLDAGWPRHMMQLTLLHECSLLNGLPAANDANLDALAERLWRVPVGGS